VRGLDHIGTMTSLHDVQARLLAFLDAHYHEAPLGGLFGKSPADVWQGVRLRTVEETTLAVALTTRARRRVRRDGTLDVDDTSWQLDQSFLSGALAITPKITTQAPFDPPGALLDQVVGRSPRHRDSEED
jgi:putative transposase